MFPNQIIWIGNNSAVACMNQCAAFGYPASGVEVSYKAWNSLHFWFIALLFSLAKNAVRVNNYDIFLTHRMTIRLWWHYRRCGKQRCFRCGNRVRDAMPGRSDSSVRWWQSFEYVLLEWSSECLAYACQHWSLWGAFYFMYSMFCWCKNFLVFGWVILLSIKWTS